MIDQALKQKVLDELAWQPGFDESDIGVTVRGGFVTLTGHVRSYAEKYAAERAAGRVTGVRAIVDEMEVRYSSGIDHGDALVVAEDSVMRARMAAGDVSARGCGATSTK